MPFEASSSGGDFVKLRELADENFDVVAIRGPSEGAYGEEYRVDIVREDGTEQTFSDQVAGHSRTRWLAEAQAYLTAHPTETIPATVVELQTKAGQTFRQLETRYVEPD